MSGRQSSGSYPESRMQVEAARLLRRLRDEDGAAVERLGSDLLLKGDAHGKRTQKISAGLARFCIVQDWLKPKGDRLHLTDAGRAWLKRQEAGEDAYRRQHQIRATGEVEIAGTRRPVAMNDGESPLGWLRNRKDRNGRPLISPAQFEAGERLRSDYSFAHLTPRVTANWGALAPNAGARRGPPTDAAGLRDEVLAAKARVTKALEAAGPELAGVLIDICCELKGLEEAEKAQGWPQRAGKVVLQIALTRLARHYGLISQEGGAAGRRLRHWGTEDYRPSLDRWGTADE